MTEPTTKTDSGDQATSAVGGRYANYVLGVLFIVYIFNFIDRQILSILAEEIKADLGVTDGEIGFLYGTAFAVFYAVFGIPLGRLADTWVRKSLISIGLLFWSVMTAMSGTARGFATLAIYRIGVGIGEASASPAAFSMLSDYFSPTRRATALAIYSSGVYVGAGIGIFLGGIILDGWTAAFPTDPPLGLKGWHVAFFAVGLPGILMAIWVWTLKEPIRGKSEGIVTPAHPHPFKETWRELAAILPIVSLTRLAAGGARMVAMNLAAGAVMIVLAWLLILQTGSTAQWVALGIGVYAAFSWSQNLAISDPATFAMVFRSKAVLFSVLGFPAIAFVSYGLGFWGPPFFQRVHGASAAETGTVLGLVSAVCGLTGVVLGGVLADKLRERHAAGKLYVGLISAVTSAPTALLMVMVEDKVVAYVLFAIFSVTSPMWIGPAASMIQDLVMPRMRAIASAFYVLMVTFIGLALGPYTIGQISDAAQSAGADPSAALSRGMLMGSGMLLVAVIGLIASMRFIEADEASRLDRARALGETV